MRPHILGRKYQESNEEEEYPLKNGEEQSGNAEDNESPPHNEYANALELSLH